MTARARAAGALSLIDGAQAVPQMPVDVRAIGADFYAWTGHKALGPTGIGVLHGRRELLERMEPFLTGGDMIASVDFESATWNELPYKFEAGTPPIAEAVGLGAAVEYLRRAGDGARARARARADGLHARAPGGGSGPARGRTARRPSAAAASRRSRSTGIHPHDVAELADRAGVCIRAGHHCAQPLMRCLGVSATARASVGVYNDRCGRRRAVDALLAGARCSDCERLGAGEAADTRWTTCTATTSSTTTSARATSASSSRTIWRRSSTTRCAATSWACTSASGTSASRTCASTATAARSRRRRRRSPRRS